MHWVGCELKWMRRKGAGTNDAWAPGGGHVALNDVRYDQFAGSLSRTDAVFGETLHGEPPAVQDFSNLKEGQRGVSQGRRALTERAPAFERIKKPSMYFSRTGHHRGTRMAEAFKEAMRGPKAATMRGVSTSP